MKNGRDFYEQIREMSSRKKNCEQSKKVKRMFKKQKTVPLYYVKTSNARLKSLQNSVS